MLGPDLTAPSPTTHAALTPMPASAVPAAPHENPAPVHALHPILPQ
ncbi:hypothetical protein HMPREF1549_01877 [Actinomyces johnsonii F0510]|uniref:Uncharacterized protein n=1 Tax=Actinomyces johnsonii F0510 TaxID=1227262 RepID=U1RF42_9ACTO|nr:hypothetical protein HMPREF1549_01877 [Actinomyces johnsonii F0510]